MVTKADLETYERNGAVTIDTPFTEEELDLAEEAWDRIKASGDPAYTDPGYVDMMQHPHFEAIAKQVLKANAVHLWWGLTPHERPAWTKPFDSPQDQWKNGCHVDIQATWEDFQATPRRMRAELWLWVNDVPADRGAMRVLPGSHRPIMEHWGKVLTPEQKAMLPRVHGLVPQPTERAVAYPEGVPELVDTPWSDHEPVPYTAKRGQMLILCSTALHSAWQNQDTEPRKAMGTAWIAEGVTCGLPKKQRDGLMAYFPELRKRLRDDRKHIAPDEYDWVVESDYEPKWEELFVGEAGDRES